MQGNYEEKNVEYQQALSDKIRRAVVAFANTNGGKVYVGIDDYGGVVGLSDPEEVKRRIAQVLQKDVFPNVMPYVEFSTESAEGKRILGVAVSRGAARPYCLDGARFTPDSVLVREGTANVPAAKARIRELTLETDGPNYEDLRSTEQELSFQYLTQIFQRNNIALDVNKSLFFGLSDESGASTNLAYLLSDRGPATIRVDLISDSEDRARATRYPSGSLLNQLDAAYQLLCQSAPQPGANANISVGTGATQDFPPAAIHEALVNAVAHRDYSDSTPTLVRRYADRIEILSYGGLVDGLDSRELGLGVSRSRNPKLAYLLQTFGLRDGCGLGLTRLRNLYAGSPCPPKIESSPNFVKTTLYRLGAQRRQFTQEADREDVRVSRFSSANYSVAPQFDGVRFFGSVDADSARRQRNDADRGFNYGSGYDDFRR